MRKRTLEARRTEVSHWEARRSHKRAAPDERCIRRAPPRSRHAECFAIRFMSTQVTYRIAKTEEGFAARSEEMGVEATGASREEALAALRAAVAQKLTTVEAVAPPSRPPPPPHIELVRAPDADSEPARVLREEPQGPGDSPAADRVSH